jgi:hypothetical protein
LKIYNDLTIIPFEEKIRLLNQTEKYRTGKLIDRLLVERHRQKQSSLSNDKGKLPHRIELLQE